MICIIVNNGCERSIPTICLNRHCKRTVLKNGTDKTIYLYLREKKVMICVWKRCSVRLYLQLFVGRFMSYLRYLCLFALVVFLLYLTSSCIPYIVCCKFL